MMDPKYRVGDVLEVHPFGVKPPYWGKVTKVEFRGAPYNAWHYFADWWIHIGPDFHNAVEGGSFYESVVGPAARADCPCTFDIDQYETCIRTGGCGV